MGDHNMVVDGSRFTLEPWRICCHGSNFCCQIETTPLQASPAILRPLPSKSLLTGASLFIHGHFGSDSWGVAKSQVFGLVHCRCGTQWRGMTKSVRT